MGDLHVQFSPDSTGVKLRTYRRGAAAGDVHDWRKIYSSDRVITNRGLVSTFRIVGSGPNNANPYVMPFWALNNGSATAAVAIRRLVIQSDCTIIGGSPMGLILFGRLTGAATGGTALAKAQFDTNLSSDAGIVFLGANDGDGNAETAITQTLAERLWEQQTMRMATTTTTGGQVVAYDNSAVASIIEDTPLIVGPGERVGIQYDGPNNGNRSTSHWFVECAFEEFTRP